MMAAGARRPLRTVAVLASIQAAASLVFAFGTRHNGAIWYQGGDQLWYVTGGWLLGQFQQPPALVGWGWSYLLAPLTWITGPTWPGLATLVIVLQVAVVAPLCVFCVYGIGAQLRGRALGLWAALLWVVVPFASIPLFVERYHERFVDQFLPQGLGFSAMADYPSMAALLGAALFVLPVDCRPFGEGRRRRRPPREPRRRDEAAELPLPRRGRSCLPRRAPPPGGGLAGGRARSRSRDPRPLEGTRRRERPALRLPGGAARDGAFVHRRRRFGRPVPRSRLGAVAAEHVRPPRVLLQRPAARVASDRGARRGGQGARVGSRAPRRLARCVPPRQGDVEARERRGQHVLPAPDAGVACLPRSRGLRRGCSSRPSSDGWESMASRSPSARSGGGPSSARPSSSGCCRSSGSVSARRFGARIVR